MRVSDYCRDFVASWEGYSGAAYLCPSGVWTIGYGHTHGVQAGDRIGAQAAKDLLAADLVSYGAQAGMSIGAANTDQQEFDAMVSLAFDVGVDGFRGSSVCRLHRKGDKDGVARAFALWNKAVIGGVLQPVLGLTRRRAAEANLYLTPDEVPMPAPMLQVAPDEMPQKVAPPPAVASSKSVIAGGATVVAGAGSVASQIDQVTPVVDSIATVGASLQSVLALVALGLSIVALAAGGFMLWRYIQKLTAGQAVST